MGKIVILDENTSNKIAAGEVIERPASVVKELLENSIDAGATQISVEIRNGGISLIKVSDNGKGIDEDDAVIAFERHATSKITTSDDLESIATFGFRGEALASIAAVSSVELTTRPTKSPHGTFVKIQGGTLRDVKPVGCPVGTTFVIRELFYNTPARFKFLKKDSTEAGYVSDIISRVALGNPNISFKLISGGAPVLHTPGNHDLQSVIFSIYGKEIARQVLPVEYQDSKVRITGYVGKPEIARATRNQQSIFINSRFIKSKIITSAIDEAYKTFLMKGKFAFAVLNITINPILVDVNVHPTKMEVRFSEEQEIFKSIYYAIHNALLSKPMVREIALSEKEKNPFKKDEMDVPKVTFTQQNMDEKLLTLKEPLKQEGTRPSAEENSIQDKKVDIEKNYKENYKENHKEYFIEDVQKGLKDIQKELKEIQKPYSIDVLNESQHQNGSVSSHAPINAQISAQQYQTTDAVFKEAQTCTQTEDKTAFSKTSDDTSAFDKTPFLKTTEAKTTHGDMQGTANMEPVKEEIKKPGSVLSNYRIIGQLFSTYILLEHEQSMILIDQHAAHERIMFEQFKERYYQNEEIAQTLIAPVAIELTNQEMRCVEEEKQLFPKLGFIFEDFGNNSIILRSVPYLEQSGIKQSFLEIVDYVMGIRKFGNKPIDDEALYQIACKAAVKANKKLDDMEIKELLKALEGIENPYSCPHGRPTIIKVTKYEIEKMFKRIV